MAELEDALDLGSSGEKPCGFDSRSSHEMYSWGEEVEASPA